MIIAQKIEAIHYHHYRPNISNPNTQIANNIQIRKSNDPNILVTYLLVDDRFACFEVRWIDYRMKTRSLWHELSGFSTRNAEP
jgi:hypothetical protein